MISTLPPQIHLLLRSMFIIRSINRDLGNIVNRFDIMARCAANVLPKSAEQTNPVLFEIKLGTLFVRSFIKTVVINSALKIRDSIKWIHNTLQG